MERLPFCIIYSKFELYRADVVVGVFARSRDGIYVDYAVL